MGARTIRVTVTLPQPLLDAAEARLAEPDESRSSMIRRLIETALKEAQEREDVEQWLRAYREQPQTEDEIGWMTEAAAAQLGEIPW